MIRLPREPFTGGLTSRHDACPDERVCSSICRIQRLWPRSWHSCRPRSVGGGAERLAALADDPAFPERLVAHRFRTSRSFGVAFALLLVLATHTLLWSLPLLVFSCTVASFRFRRVIYRESWSLAGYLSFVIRASVAIFGFWLLLAGLPALAGLAGSYGWFVALALCLLLVIWNARYTDAVRLLLRANVRSTIQTSLRKVHRTCAGQHRRNAALRASQTWRRSDCERDRPPGGEPSGRPFHRHSAVSPEKTTRVVAICGHELAHLGTLQCAPHAAAQRR